MSLMLFFSFTLFIGRLARSSAYRNYKCACRRMSLALLVLSVNYGVHLFVAPRFSHSECAILMNICTYFLAAWLFGSSMLQLIERGYNSVRRDCLNVLAWVLFSLVTTAALWAVPPGGGRIVVLLVSSLLFMLYTLRIALRLVHSYRRAVRLLDSYHSDDVAAYVRWVSVFTYLAVFYGIGQGVFTFIPDRYVFLWILSSIPFYSYGYISYVKYAFEVKKVDEALNADTESAAVPQQPSCHDTAKESDSAASTPIDSQVARQIDEWIRCGSFTQQGLTIAQLAQQICTNRTYLSSFINSHYRMSFRDWINALRLDYAKQLLATSPDITITDAAQRAGYLSLSNFTRLFTASEGTSPGRWRKENARWDAADAGAE